MGWLPIFLLVLFMAGVGATLFKQNSVFEKFDLDEQTRAALPGKFIKLSDGATHYEIHGKKSAPVAVLIHGFSAPSYTWDLTFSALTTAGFRVLRYDMFGRGYSDRPRKPYNIELCVAQLCELLDRLEITRPVHLVGLSYGGSVAAKFACLFPGSVRSLALIDPLVTANVLQKVRILNVPGLGELFMKVYLSPIALPQSQVDDFYHHEKFHFWSELYRQQMRYKGFNRAILSAFRNIGKLTLEADYRAIGSMTMPVLCLRGEHDQTITSKDVTLLTELIPQLHFKLIKNAGHVPHYEQAGIVNPILIGFLESN